MGERINNVLISTSYMSNMQNKPINSRPNIIVTVSPVLQLWNENSHKYNI